jgi:hypothetical protein
VKMQVAAEGPTIPDLAVLTLDHNRAATE